MDLLNGPDLYGNVGWDDSLLPGDDSGGSETTNPIAAFNQWVAQATDSTEGQDDALDPDYFTAGSLIANDANYWAGTSLTLTGLAFSVARGPNDTGFGEMLGPEGLFLAAPGLVAGVGEAATAGFEGLMGWFAGDAAEGAAGTTTLFRAVSSGELADIEATGAYQSLAGQTEGKYFFDTAEQASNFAKMMGDGPYTTTSVEVLEEELTLGQRNNPAGEGPGYFFPSPNIPSGPVNIFNFSVVP